MGGTIGTNSCCLVDPVRTAMLARTDRGPNWRACLRRWPLGKRRGPTTRRSQLHQSAPTARAFLLALRFGLGACRAQRRHLRDPEPLPDPVWHHAMVTARQTRECRFESRWQADRISLTRMGCPRYHQSLLASPISNYTFFHSRLNPGSIAVAADPCHRRGVAANISVAR
jgi:hypothetical protein